MNGRIEQLSQIAALLDEGKIDRFEYEVLKEELLTLQPGPRSPSGSARDVPESLTATLSEDINKLKQQTLHALGFSSHTMAESEPGRLLLRGVDAFTKGVLAFAILGVAGDAQLEPLIEERPVVRRIAIYVGATKTVDDICERYANQPMPYEFRGIMAAFSMFAWQALQEAGIRIDPGQGNMPAEIFDRLGVGEEDSEADPNEDGRPSRSLTTPRSTSKPTSLESVVAQVHGEMGLSDLPVTVGIAAIDALELIAATGLLHTAGEFDPFRHLIGNLQRPLNKSQRKLLGYSLLNSYPATAVEYVQRVVVRGVEAGVLDYSPEFADLIKARPPGT